MTRRPARTSCRETLLRTLVCAAVGAVLSAAPLVGQVATCQVDPGQDVGRIGVEVDSVARSHLAEAYRLLDLDEIEAAVGELEQAIASAPCRAATHAQLGYAYVQTGRDQAGLEQLTYARELGYEDPRGALQIAYLAEKLGDSFRARRYFVRAMRGDDPEVARQAEAELRVRAAAPGMTITEVYAAPVFQGRFDNLVVPVVVRSGPILEAEYLLQPYALLRYTRDSRSEFGEQPRIFSENAVIPGVGIRRRLSSGTLTGYVEAGAVLDLADATTANSQAGASLQAGIYDFRSFGLIRDPAPASPTRGFFAELYYDASYYSRFDHNGIGYLQLRPGYRTNGWAGGTLDLYAPVLAVGDVRGFGFNNLIEAGLGARYTLGGLGGVTASAEYLVGSYLRDPVAGVQGYDDFRLTLSTPVYLTQGRR